VSSVTSHKDRRNIEYAVAPSASAPHRRPPFRLTRFFFTTSLIGILAVTACLIAVYREFTLRQLIEHESRANADLTRAFANVVWDNYRPLVLGAHGRTRAALLADPALAALRSDVLAKMKGLKVAKIKIYNLDGLTVFSTDERQIGEDKSANPGFRAAKAGRVVSDITYRDRFDAFEGVLSRRNLIFSYIPVRPSAGGPSEGVFAEPEGVFEVYSDVTELLAQQSRAQWQVAAIVLAALATLYLFLYFVVRKADRIIARQERERAEKEEQIHHQAYHDTLTGLPNRSGFAPRLNEALAAAARHARSGAVMFIDLDRFKRVNDSLGHDAGDLLLKLVSTRIHDCLRKSDLLFRMGGDEFMVVMPEIAAPENAADVARRISAAVAAPAPIHGHDLVVGATIGIAVFPADGDNVEALVKKADAAMYAAKERGRGTHAFHGAAAPASFQPMRPIVA
jgi:diguanylate cyclase (GGDEF)-like protein